MTRGDPGRPARFALASFVLVATLLVPTTLPAQERTQKPPLHAQSWMAITGKPLAATAGAMTFQRGGNAVDAACAMLAATSTMWDTLSWGGETQALLWHPREKRVIAINALGVAPTGATVQFFRGRGMKYPPEYGPLAAVTPGTPGGLLVMLAEYGTLSLAEVLAPAIELADGFPVEAELANRIERDKAMLKQWPESARVMLPHAGEAREAPRAGEIFRQPDLAATLRRLVEAERRALQRGASRKAAIQAAYDLFYRGELGAEFAAAVRRQGGLVTRGDLANWRVRIEAPRSTTYRGIEVYKLDTWVQGPAMLQALNILETFDLKSMGYNSTRYLHTLYQAMSLAFADRDFYYGDPAFPPEEPIRGLLSKDYARARAGTIGERNDPTIAPGDPYPFQGGVNPFAELLRQYRERAAAPREAAGRSDATSPAPRPFTPGGVVPTASSRRPDDADDPSWRGTTSIVAADRQGWLVSVTPSGGWVPAVIAGRTGIGLSQRMQSFVLDPAENPYNVLEPGKRPRATLTPTLALRDGKPWLAFAVQGGDSQDQNLLQFLLNVTEFGMTPQQASEAPNMNSFQLHDSFGEHPIAPGRMLLHDATPPWQRHELQSLGYRLEFQPRTSGPINAILVDPANGTFWGGSSNHGEDYGIGW
ncbi:MAG: gamma-glutamyltransferase [Steroidobacteraceae bacterium]|nr:gamma-glutamyltransferase [Steroidobacteraceae bacterium]